MQVKQLGRDADQILGTIRFGQEADFFVARGSNARSLTARSMPARRRSVRADLRRALVFVDRQGGAQAELSGTDDVAEIDYAGSPEW